MAVKFILESLCRATAVREKGFSSFPCLMCLKYFLAHNFCQGVQAHQEMTFLW